MGRFKITNITCITTEDKKCIYLSEYLRKQGVVLLDDDKLYKRPRIIYTPKKTHMFEIYDEVIEGDKLLLYNINKKLDLLLYHFNTI